MIAHTAVKIVLSLVSLMLLVACGQEQDTQQPQAGTRSVILFVGDGFGAAQTSLGIQYARLIEDRELNIESLMRDGNTGYALSLPFDSIVTDSAAAATQFATGQAARNETLGLNSDGYPIETILEWAHQRGLGTGLVTNMRITHATPAAFAVHRGSRYDGEQTLMDDILQDRDVDVLLGGGARAMVPAGSWVSEALPGIPKELDGESIRDDELNRVEELAGQGYTETDIARILFWGCSTLCVVLFLIATGGLSRSKPAEAREHDSVLVLMRSGLQIARNNGRVALGYATAFAARGDILVVGTFSFLWTQQAAEDLGLGMVEGYQRGGMIVGVIQGSALTWALVMGFL